MNVNVNSDEIFDRICVSHDDVPVWSISRTKVVSYLSQYPRKQVLELWPHPLLLRNHLREQLKLKALSLREASRILISCGWVPGDDIGVDPTLRGKALPVQLPPGAPVQLARNTIAAVGDIIEYHTSRREKVKKTFRAIVLGDGCLQDVDTDGKAYPPNRWLSRVSQRSQHDLRHEWRRVRVIGDLNNGGL